MKNILLISCLLFFSLSAYSQKLKIENGYVLVYSKNVTVDIGFDSLNIKEYKDYALLFIKKKDSVVLKNNNIDFQNFICNSKVNVLFFEPRITFFQQKDNKLLLLDSVIEDSTNQIVIVPCYLLISEELYVTEYFERYSLYNYSTFLNKEMLKTQSKKKDMLLNILFGNI